MRTLSPVVYGRTLPANPFDPAAPASAHGIPIVIGCTRDEATMFTGADPRFGKMTADEAAARFKAVLGDRGPAALAAYKAAYPSDAPTYWFTSMMTQRGTWMDSVRLAERQLAQGGAKVFMYRVDWNLPILDGALRSPHGTDVPLVFDTTERAPLIMGTGPEAKRLSRLVSQAWIDFARTGDPSQPGFAWPAYDTQGRKTALFDNDSKVVSDPDGELRRFWNQS
jgi:para-nitrobenzyl esterase